jgi:hypothetical protein
MNTSIWSNFTGFQSQNTLNQNFSDTVIKSSEQQKATYERVAGYCKSWYAPVFASDKDLTDSDSWSWRRSCSCRFERECVRAINSGFDYSPNEN